jgi:SNF2 family DNA or RNA helicase
MLVLDEVTKMKDAGSKRHHALRKILPYLPYRLGLTGTPAANGYLDLFGQYLAIDSGDRLGTSLTDYKRTYFTQGFMAYQLDLKPFADEDIQQKIKDITLQMDAKDYLELPEVIFNDIYVDLPAKARKIYAELERDLFMELDNGIEIEVHSNAALSNKCLQAASGCVYDEEGLPHEIHKVKLEALDDVYEEAAGQPLLVLVQFKFDIDRIMKRYPDAVFFGGSKCDPVDIVRRWDAGQIRMLVGHPASMGHGLNLQYGGHIGVWFGMNWSLDLVLQANARLDRQGQKLPVIFHRILTRDTLDMMQLDALENKAVTQTGLRQALKRYRHGQ